MHGAAFFLDCNAKRIEFWEVCSPSAAGIHTPLSTPTAEGFSTFFNIEMLGKKPKTHQNPQSEGSTRLPGYAKVALGTWDVSKQHMSYYRKLLSANPSSFPG